MNEHIFVPSTPPSTAFGRLYTPDPRDMEYRLQAPGLRSLIRRHRMWTAGPITDQGDQPHCVGHAWRQLLTASPTRARHHDRTLPAPQLIYARAQAVDEWPGTNYDGTSVRAGAKVLQAEGFIKEYRWAGDIDTARQFVLARGPLVVGTEWYVRMSKPLDLTDGMWLDPSGGNQGGHAYVFIGYSRSRKAFRIVNSWGRAWGEGGRAWMDEQVAAGLLFAQNGEACSAVEV